MLAELRKADPEAKLAPWRLHDLRRTAASGMARLGVAVHVVEALLNHKSGTISGVAAVYNRHDYAAEKRAAAQAWANYLDSLTAEKPANVVQLHA
jgi:integrase